MFHLWLIPNTHYFLKFDTNYISNVECLPLSFFLKKKNLRLQHDDQIDLHDLLPRGLSQAGISIGAKGCHFKTSSGSSERIKTAALILVVP